MRNYKLILMLIVCVLSMVVLTACSSPQVEAMAKTVTAEELIGTWLSQTGPLDFQFRDDGTFSAGSIVNSVSIGVSQYVGTYTVENGVLILTNSEPNGSCSDGNFGKYALSFGDSGELELQLKWDECYQEVPSSAPQLFTWIEEG